MYFSVLSLGRQKGLPGQALGVLYELVLPVLVTVDQSICQYNFMAAAINLYWYVPRVINLKAFWQQTHITGSCMSSSVALHIGEQHQINGNLLTMVLPWWILNEIQSRCIIGAMTKVTFQSVYFLWLFIQTFVYFIGSEFVCSGFFDDAKQVCRRVADVMVQTSGLPFIKNGLP